MDDKKITKNALKSKLTYICEDCNYNTIHKRDYNRHILTAKHLKRINDYKKTIILYSCDCGKTYKYRQGLWKHKRKCNYKNLESKEKENENILKLITENKELRNLLLKQSEQISELIPKVGNNNNNNNKQFNINVFLNEKCKDAISIKDFVENITITMRDLDFTKANGNIKGITNIITNNLSKLSLYKRPLHCYDKQDKVLYIKNKEWERDDDYKQINAIIASVETRQIKQLSKWTQENPDYMQSEAKQHEFIKIVNETMANEPDTRDKIIKTLCEKVMLRAQAL